MKAIWIDGEIQRQFKTAVCEHAIRSGKSLTMREIAELLVKEYLRNPEILNGKHANKVKV